MSQLYQYYTNAVAGTSAQPVPGLFDMDPHYKNAGLTIRSAVLDDGVAYLYFSQFALSPYLVKGFGYFDSASQTVLAQNQEIVDVWYNWFEQIQEMKKSGTLKGVIIDVRSNGGGFVYDFRFVLGALLPQDSKLQTGYLREKSGVGRYDYGPLLPDERPVLSVPHETITEPIVVLTNCMTASMSEETAMGAKALSNACVVGKRSWGATGALSDDPKYYSTVYAGCIGKEGITPVYIYLPRCATFSMDNKCYEGVGVEPDIEVDLDVDLFNTTGCDTQLERALQYIENGN
jgi:C-terminal processing protease CtpA/Prc